MMPVPPNSALDRAILSSATSISADASVPPQYFSQEEIRRLLENKVFVPNVDATPKDNWKDVNSFRSMVTSALNNGLSDIVTANAKDGRSIVEIGSGIGYALSGNLSSQTIRTQTTPSECQLLSQTTWDPIYRVNIEELHNSLIESGKKIPLVFALHVFDTMLPEERKVNLQRISQLQDKGDRVLMMLDSNPCVESTLKELEQRYPRFAALPFFPLTGPNYKLSFVMVPVELIDCNPAEINVVGLILAESKFAMHGQVSEMQVDLNTMQKQFNLRVIELEDFFVEQVKSELAQTGYSAKVYYHAAFTTEEITKKTSFIKQDLIYKPVTDSRGSVRQWSLNDKNFIGRLEQKGLKLPSHFNDAFLEDLRKKEQKIIGAEILVIEATKI